MTRMDAMNVKRLLTNEDGSVLVIAIIMLVLLTALGISATTTSTIEIQIAGNQRTYKQNLYRAEAAAMECAQRIENGGSEIKDPSSFPTWLHNAEDDDLPDDITDAEWDDTDSQTSLDGSRFIVVFRGIPPGESIDVSKGKKVYSYNLYGLSNRHNSLVAIRGGYKRAF
jgi:type IV pilus assembly protein PilX